jgi:phage-related baseplate assembly protein
MPGDIVGVHSVSGGNALLFYTTPPIRVINRDVDFYAAICSAGRAWIVAGPTEATRFTALAREVGRSADVVAAAPSGPKPRAALLHVFGAPCNKAVATRLISQLRRRRPQ